MVDTGYTAAAQTYETIEEPTSSRWQHLRHLLLKRVWYVHPGAYLRLKLSPSQTFKILEIAAKPSVERLHLRDVFSQGRRYFIYAKKGGSFRMVTTNKIPWYPRRRTSVSAVLNGDFEAIDETTTRLKLHSRIQIFYLLQSLFMPTFMTSMLVFMAWHVAIIIFCIGALYTLSWLGHRYNAALEAYEMVFFIEKALEDFIPAPPPVLASESTVADVVLESGFAKAWDKFVNEMQDE
jgi:hypothetical protein